MHLGRGDQVLGELLGVQTPFDPAQVTDLGRCLHLTRGQHGAAVLVGQLGDGQSSDPAGLVHDLGLVHADERAQDRQVDRIVQGGDVGHRLTGDLAQCVTGDETFGLQVVGQCLGGLEHQATLSDDLQPFVARTLQLLLGLAEGHHEQARTHLVTVQPADQAVSLVDGLRPGERHPGEVQEIDLQTAADHPVRCDGGIDSARHQHQTASAHSAGQPPLPGDAVGEHEHLILVHLHVQGVVGVFEVHPVPVGIDDPCTQVTGQLGRGHLETFVATTGPYCEGALAVGHRTHRHIGDRVQILGYPAHQVHPHHAHDVGHTIGDLGDLQVRGITLAEDDHARTALGQSDISQVPYRGTDVVVQAAFEELTVGAFENDLPEFHEYTELAQTGVVPDLGHGERCVLERR